MRVPSFSNITKTRESSVSARVALIFHSLRSPAPARRFSIALRDARETMRSITLTSARQIWLWMHRQWRWKGTKMLKGVSSAWQTLATPVSWTALSNAWVIHGHLLNISLTSTLNRKSTMITHWALRVSLPHNTQDFWMSCGTNQVMCILPAILRGSLVRRTPCLQDTISMIRKSSWTSFLMPSMRILIACSKSPMLSKAIPKIDLIMWWPRSIGKGIWREISQLLSISYKVSIRAL